MNTQQISFAIQGMYCARCAVAIEQALMRLDGILGAHVNYATEHATVTYDPVRASAARMVDAVRDAGYDVAVDTLTLSVSDLWYATSARAVQQIVSGAAGIVAVTVDLAAGRVKLEALAGHAHPDEVERSLARLDLHVGSSPSAYAAFVVRALLLIVIALTLVGSTLSQLDQPPSWPIMPGLLAALGIFGVGWPFYRRAFAAFVHGALDASVGVALLGAFFFGCNAVALWLPWLRLGAGWSAPVGVISATLLTAGWFGARGVLLWSVTRSRQVESSNLTAQTDGTPSIPGQRRRWLLPSLTGMIAAIGLIGLYLAILSVAQGAAHALDQLAQDRLWVGLVALGFGTQVGLYAYLRLVAQALKLAGATAMTGVGTGTSTLGMIACCAHHVTDFTPLVVLMGASGLSGAVSALTEWKYLFIAGGLVVNAAGVAITLRTIRASRAHLRMLTGAAATGPGVAPVCH